MYIQTFSSKIGGVSMLFANLSRQLQNYQQFGPPPIESAMVTYEDIRFAKETVQLADDVVSESAENQNLCEETPEIKLKEVNEKTLSYDVSVPSANIVMETMIYIEYGADVFNLALSSAYSLKHSLQNLFYRLNTGLFLTKIQSFYSLKDKKYRLI